MALYCALARALIAVPSRRGPALLLSLLTACAAPRAPSTAAPGGQGADVTNAGEPSPLPPGAPGSTASGGVSGKAPTASFPALPLPGGEQPTPDRALPELRVEALGMHVGGGKNDAEEKAPFQRALEQRFSAFMDCYRLVEDPWAGGSFGVDLKIPRAGGAPTAEQPRTRIRGAGFEACMLKAFGQVQFEKPKAGPTVISYSIRFVLGPRGKQSR